WLLVLFSAGLAGCENPFVGFFRSLKQRQATDSTLAVHTALDSNAALGDRPVRRNLPAPKDSTPVPFKGGPIRTGDLQPDALVDFAETLIGVPYVYGSTDPNTGFDCSGFITYVFRHFGISVPRSSIDFTHVGTPVPPEEARRGDIVLFTGTNPLERHVGHMGIVTENKDGLVHFIHSTSGKAMGVTITPLSEYYKERYVKTIRIF
ncbi:MAG TPA: NlpC/P60 family protein, partial [Chitinophagaceae bacterium]|nr:NlpC/P60 family protein [Chitinophagaceae bacterium]